VRIYDFIITRGELVEDSLRHAESPIADSSSGIAADSGKNRVVMAVVVMEVASEFLQTYRFRKSSSRVRSPQGGWAVPS